MKTDELVAALARSAGPAPRAVVAKRLVPVVGAGFVISALIAVAALGVAPVGPATLWMKFAYAGALVASAGWLCSRLSRPGAEVARARSALVVVVVAMLAVGAATLIGDTPEARRASTFGASWTMCPWAILGLAAPTLAATLSVMRGLAPTRPVFAGFAAGVLAGAVAASGYAIACVETSPTFVSLWYSMGIVLAGLCGALIGRWALRW